MAALDLPTVRLTTDFAYEREGVLTSCRIILRIRLAFIAFSASFGESTVRKFEPVRRAAQRCAPLDSLTFRFASMR
jgi:hypothetical protein